MSLYRYIKITACSSRDAFENLSTRSLVEAEFIDCLVNDSRSCFFKIGVAISMPFECRRFATEL